MAFGRAQESADLEIPLLASLAGRPSTDPTSASSAMNGPTANTGAGAAWAARQAHQVWSKHFDHVANCAILGRMQRANGSRHTL